jgi:hypothetical protein
MGTERTEEPPSGNIANGCDTIFSKIRVVKDMMSSHTLAHSAPAAGG